MLTFRGCLAVRGDQVKNTMNDIEREEGQRESGERIAELQQQFSAIPRSIVLKADVLTEGVRYTPALTTIGKWALPQIHFIFEWDHDDVHRQEDLTAGSITL